MVGNPQSWNRFTYVGNNPLRYVDPIGLCRVDVRFKALQGGPHHHAYILTTEADGTQTYFRGGPSGGGPSSGGSGVTTSAGGGGSSGASGSGSSRSSDSGNSSSPGSGEGGAERNNGPWGPIVTDSGPYVPGTIDYQTGTPPSVTVHDDDKACDELNKKLGSAMQAIEDKAVPYNPFTQNSNSTVREALERSGLRQPVPPVWAPAWQTQLP